MRKIAFRAADRASRAPGWQSLLRKSSAGSGQPTAPDPRASFRGIAIRVWLMAGR